ncbi:esterase B1-like [Topomyia yanbarensis]|uniref:esterase B1-like n=1 Tax=Topomyia yanbarensis TaxID=2498891 RepID=UPI00273AD45F|nr:esterase B1-like [Topomyia yanbarensis]
MDIQNPIVSTKYGPVRGIRKTAATGVDYYSFQRIPYVKTPIGELRFKDSQPPTPWMEPLDCTVQGPGCYQYSKLLNKIIGSEDSLHMNVFTKNLEKGSKLLPVLLYIHGGAFMRGSSGVEMYGPDYLIQKDVVYVSFNYRIGALGFISFSSPELELPGNAGLKDQNLALRWVVENISNFGGDPKNITLFGESAGGCSVHYHMVSEQSKGLFQRAIVMSGCVLNNWSVVPQRQFSERLAKALGWNGQGGEKAALDVLMQADPVEIVREQEILLTENELENRILFAFGPVIEPYAKANCFIPNDPLKMSRNAWSNDIDIIIGGNSEEGLFCLSGIKENPSIMSNLKNFEYLVPLDLDLVRTSQQCKELGMRLKKFYYGDSEPSLENRDGYLTLMTDKLFWHGVHRTICSRMNLQKNANTYVYRFSVDSDTYNHYRINFCDKNVRGTAHADDLSYIFKNAFGDAPPKDSFEYRVMMNMVDLIFTFASNNGNPNGVATNEWEPVGSQVGPYKCLNIANDGLKFIDFPEMKRMELWDSLYTKDQLY